MKKIILSVLMVFIMNNLQSQDNVKLIYVGDPMCSWCYGIAPEWQKVREEYKDKVKIEYVMGGLRPYYKKPISEMKDFLSEHWEHVHEASDQPFNYEILNRSDLNYDTEPPSRAVVVMQELNPDAVGSFFADTQSLFYYQNKDMNKSSSYHSLLKKYKVDTEEFDQLYNSDSIKEATKAEFDKAKSLGVTSFPTVLLMIDEEQYIVTQGYSTSDKMSKVITNLLSK
jgi:putative protein-disulfide isomerase